VRPEQVELLSTIVGADRNVPPTQRQPFFFSHVANNDPRALIDHPGLATGTCRAYLSDLEELGDAGLIELRYAGSRYSGDFDGAPLPSHLISRCNDAKGSPWNSSLIPSGITSPPKSSSESTPPRIQSG
jgi:hypothetical protein